MTDVPQKIASNQLSQNQFHEKIKQQQQNNQQQSVIQFHENPQAIIEKKEKIDILKVQINVQEAKNTPQIQQIKNQNQNQNQNQSHSYHQQQQKQPYGPFSLIKNQIELKLVNENLNILIQPVVNEPTQKINSNKTRKYNIIKKKKIQKSINKNVLTQQSTQITQTRQRYNAQQLQNEILMLAKGIRQKVKKNNNQPVKQITQYLVTRQNKKQKRSQINNKINYVNRSSIETKSILNTYEKNVQTQAQAQIQKQQQSILQHEKPQQSQQNLIQIFVKKNKSKQVVKQSSIIFPKIKLNLDPTHHKYRTTQFRKSILKQKKQKQLQKQQQIKQKVQILNKRRQLYYQSRFHPVGVQLNQRKLIKISNIQHYDNQQSTQLKIKQIVSNQTNQLKSIVLNQKKLQKQLSLDQTNKIQQVTQDKIQQVTQDKIQQVTQDNNNQMTKSRIILIQSIQHQQTKTQTQYNHHIQDNQIVYYKKDRTEKQKQKQKPKQKQNKLKSTSQLYRDLQSLTLQLQNDSTFQQKLEGKNKSIQKIEITL